MWSDDINALDEYFSSTSAEDFDITTKLDADDLETLEEIVQTVMDIVLSHGSVSVIMTLVEPTTLTTKCDLQAHMVGEGILLRIRRISQRSKIPTACQDGRGMEKAQDRGHSARHCQN